MKKYVLLYIRSKTALLYTRYRAISPKGGVKMQNNYETIMIVNSNLEEAAIKDTIAKISALISEHGTVESTEEWGKKRLAYPIKKQNEGYYVLINFSSNPEFINELDRIYNITDEVIKHIIVKK